MKTTSPEDEIDLVLGEPARDSRKEKILVNDQFYSFSKEDQSQSKLDASDNRLGEKFGECVHRACDVQDDEDRAENDAGRSNYGFGNLSRIGNGNGSHRLQGLDGYRQAVVEAGNKIKQPEGEENGRWAQLVDEDHAHHDGKQSAQIPKRTGQFHPIKAQTGRHP